MQATIRHIEGGLVHEKPSDLDSPIRAGRVRSLTKSWDRSANIFRCSLMRHPPALKFGKPCKPLLRCVSPFWTGSGLGCKESTGASEGALTDGQKATVYPPSDNKMVRTERNVSSRLVPLLFSLSVLFILDEAVLWT